MKMVNYIKRIIIFAAILSAIAYLIYYQFIPQFYLSIFPFLVFFFVAITISVHAVLTKAGKQKIARFSTYYLGSISVKLFIYIIFITVYSFSNKESAVPFLITFLVLYFFFTFYETYALLSDLKKQSPTNK